MDEGVPKVERLSADMWHVLHGFQEIPGKVILLAAVSRIGRIVGLIPFLERVPLAAPRQVGVPPGTPVIRLTVRDGVTVRFFCNDDTG